MKIYRPEEEPNAVVIDFEDESMPAYIANCAEYAFEAIKKAAQQPRAADGDNMAQISKLRWSCGWFTPPPLTQTVRRHTEKEVMKKISSKERRLAGNIYCPYCKPQKVNAVWRKDGDCNKRFDVACEEHKSKVFEPADERLTEADLQTWTRT